jgi:hypothetical protein
MAPDGLELTFMIICLLLSSILLPLYIKLNARGDARIVKIFAIIILIAAACVSISIYGQNGCFEACSIFFAIHLSSIIILFSRVFLLVAVPLIKGVPGLHRHERYFQVFLFIERLGCVALWIAYIPGIIFIRNDTVGKRNLAIDFSLFVLGTVFIVYNLGAWIISVTLNNILQTNLSEIRQTMNKSEVTKRLDLIKRLKVLKLASLLSISMVGTPLLVIAIVLAILGTFPFFGILIVIMFVNGYIFIAALLRVLDSHVGSSSSSKSKSSTPLSNNDKTNIIWYYCMKLNNRTGINNKNDNIVSAQVNIQNNSPVVNNINNNNT